MTATASTMMRAATNAQSRKTLRKVLLICGVLSSLFYVGTDLLAGTLWEGYSFTSQYISELSAIGAPTRPLVFSLFITYGVLLTAFGLGVWESAGRRRVLRVVAGMLVGDAVVGLVATLFFPMHLRGVEATLTDVMHASLTVAEVLSILLAMVFGAAAYRNWFRFYSIGAILMLLGPGVLAFMAAPSVAAQQATPWIGVVERVTIYGYLLWVAVLAVILLRAEMVPGSTRMRTDQGRIEVTKSNAISGFVKPGFEAVREAFVENFEHRNELGAACCIYFRGEKVVDLWGGIRNKATGEPWEENTMAVVFSTTKGLAGLAMALAHSRGLFDYGEPVSKYWPEFAQQGKEKITVRQLLSHQAGLYALDVPVERSLVADLDRLAVVLARQKPAWEPGARQAYHAITLGFYESELLRRVDPKHRSLGQFFQEEIASPLSLDAYIRLPEEVPNSRFAVLSFPARRAMMILIFTMPPLFAFATMNPRSRIRRALDGSALPIEKGERVYARNLEIPSGGAVASACGIARAYSVFANGGRELGLREETLEQLMAPAVMPVHGFHDECLKTDVRFSLGFMKPGPKNPFGHPGSFGAPGSGGSFGFADPQAKIGYAYVPNLMGSHLEDPRDLSLRTAMYRSIGEINPYREGAQLRTKYAKVMNLL